jgi:RsiW-degrading membrane proteinase PrsW (M82 family)
MFVLLTAAIAPGLALLSYFYLRDHFESEPVKTVFRVFLSGAIVTFPIMFFQYVLEYEHLLSSQFWKAFVVSGMLEEFFKWFVLIFTIYQHVEFNEPYDGIVYGVAASLGFATVENILYLATHGVTLAFGRALLPVSSHALFGVIMGYYLGKAKFSTRELSLKWIWLSLLIPVFLHGVYDYILIQTTNWLYYMIPFMFFLWWLGLRKTKHAHLLSKVFFEKQGKAQ